MFSTQQQQHLQMLRQHQQQQMLTQNQQFQNPGLLANTNASFLSAPIHIQAYGMNPNHQPYQILPNGQIQYIIPPQLGYAAHSQFTYPEAYPQQIFTNGYSSSTFNNNQSFSLFPPNQGNTFSLFIDNTAQPTLLTRSNTHAEKTLGSYNKNPFDAHDYMKERTNVFRRSPDDMSSRLNARFDHSADNPSRLPYNIFTDRRKDVPLKTRAHSRHGSGVALEMIFNKKRDSLITRRDKDDFNNDMNRRPKHCGHSAVYNQSYSSNLSRNERMRSSSPTFHRANRGKDRFQEEIVRVDILAIIGQKEYKLDIPVVGTEKIEWLKQLILKELHYIDLGNAIKTSKLMLNSRELRNEEIIASCIRDEDMVVLVAKECNHSEIATPTRASDSSRPKITEHDTFTRKIANSSLVPILTRPGYSTRPSIDQLRTYTESELRQVENFIVENEHGRVEFEGRTDVIGVNLDELVEINPKLAEVYPEKLYPSEESKPKVGTKLNKPSYVVLYNCYFDSKSKTEEEVIQILKKKAIKSGAELVSYKSGTYIIKVPHFTRYGFEDSGGDSEDEEEEKTASFQPEAAPQRRYNYQEYNDIIMMHKRKEIEVSGFSITNDSNLSRRNIVGSHASEILNQQKNRSQLSDSLFKDSDKQDYNNIEPVENQQTIEEEGDERVESESNQSKNRTTSNNIHTDEFRSGFKKKHRIDQNDAISLLSEHRNITRNGQEHKSGIPRKEIQIKNLNPESIDEEEEIEEDKTMYSTDDIQEGKTGAEDFNEKDTIQILHEADSFLKWLNMKPLGLSQIKYKRPQFEPLESGVSASSIEESIIKLNKKLFMTSVATTRLNYSAVSHQPEPQREFSLHRSFRVGWSRDGLIVPTQRGRSHVLQVSKIILHKHLYEECLESKRPYHEYRRKLKSIASRV